MFYLAKKQFAAQGDAILQGKQLDWSSRFALLAKTSKYPALKAFYQQGVVPPSTLISEVPMVALDFETTGLDPNQDSIVSIGLVPMSISRIRCNAARHWIIKPETRLHSSSVVVHGITHSAVADAPDFSSLIDKLLGCLQGKIVVAHHSPIEQRFLNAALKRHIHEGIEFPVIDTMALEARFTRSIRKIFWRSLLARQSESIRLTDSRTRYHLPYYRQHNALTDALACAELLQAQCATNLTADTPIGAIWS
ncbi:3'-5' exonuclease [Zhongshania arctica]|uniref:DNA-directed DNA polymerase n=1 Tax=Zhongshania arctica TaxID=3238302 RepID=A0ABV3TWP8_9GAMM